jgi:cytochrome P450
MLAMHKDSQQKVIDEIDEIIGSGDEITSEDMSKFTFTEMAIKESLRLFGPGGILARQTTQEIELGGYTIPNDTCLVLSVFGMQRSKKIWGDDAHLFRPERFEPENLKSVHPHGLAPFSGGKRVCIGHRYAMAFMKVFVAHFFRAYTIDTGLKYDEITIDMIPTLVVSQKYMLSVRKRFE